MKGSPHFFCADEEAFCPSLRISAGGTGHVHVKPNVEVLDRFLRGCLRAA